MGRILEGLVAERMDEYAEGRGLVHAWLPEDRVKSEGKLSFGPGNLKRRLRTTERERQVDAGETHPQSWSQS